MKRHADFDRFGIEYHKGDDWNGTRYVDTITQAIKEAEKLQKIGYKTRFITADQYGIRIEYID